MLHISFLLIVTLLVTESSGINCQYGSGVQVKSMSCNKRTGICRYVWSGTNVLQPGESQCFRIDNDHYIIEPVSTIIRLNTFNNKKCVPLIRSSTKSDCGVANDIDYEPDNLGRMTVWQNVADSAEVKSFCNDIDSLNMCGTEKVKVGNSQKCSNLYAKGVETENWALTFYTYKCYLGWCWVFKNPYVSIFFSYCIEKSNEFNVAVPEVLGSLVTFNFYINGVIQNLSSDFNIVGSSNAQFPLQQMTLLRNVTSGQEYMIKEIIEEGKPQDLCAVTLDENRKKVASGQWLTVENDCGFFHKTSEVYVIGYSRKSTGVAIPYLDPVSNINYKWSQIELPSTYTVTLSFTVIRDGNFSSEYDDFDANDYNIEFDVGNCRIGNLLKIFGRIKPVSVQWSSGCELIDKGSSDEPFLYTLVNQESINNYCELTVSSVSNYKIFKINITSMNCSKTDYDSFNYSIITNDDNGWDLSIFNFGGLFSNISTLMKTLCCVLILVIFVCILFKILPLLKTSSSSNFTKHIYLGKNSE